MNRNHKQQLKNKQGKFQSTKNKTIEVVTVKNNKETNTVIIQQSGSTEYTPTSILSDIEFIQTIKKQLYEGYYYKEQVEKAYRMIIKNDYPATHIVMRRTILNHP